MMRVERENTVGRLGYKEPATLTSWRRTKLAAIFLLILSLLCFSGCNNATKASADVTKEKGPVERSYWPTTDWKSASAEDHGMDLKIINELTEKVKKDEIYSMVMVKDGYIVSEYYDKNYKKTSKFRFDNCARSITSALMGMVIDKKYLKDVDMKLADIYYILTDKSVDERKRQITIKNLLNGTSGISWPEWTDWKYDVSFMVQSTNWVNFVLNRGMEAEPGKRFNYNTGESHILSDIITKMSKTNTFNFAKENLFSTIGIKSVKWLKEPKGPYAGGHGIDMTARDAAKFGFLYLNDGVWDGKRVISHSWIEASTTKQSDGAAQYGSYGYGWWLRDFKIGDKTYKSYFAMGYNGQYIFVVPEADIVAVFSSWMPGDDSLKPIKYMENYILKALK